MQDLHHQYHSAKSPRPTWPQPFCVDPEASSKIGFHPETLCIYIYILCPKKENHEFLLISNRDTHMHRSLFSWYFFFEIAWQTLASKPSKHLTVFPMLFHVPPVDLPNACPAPARPRAHVEHFSSKGEASRVEMKLCFSSLMIFERKDEQSLLDAFVLNVLFTKWSNSRSCGIAEPCAAFPVWMPQALTYNQRLEQRPQLQRIKWERPSPSSMW